jgi:general secretion pathway protein E
MSPEASMRETYGKTLVELGKENLERLGLSLKEGKTCTVKYGEGCVNCRGTGYLGRTGVFEVMNLSDEIKKLVTSRTDAGEIKSRLGKKA